VIDILGEWLAADPEAIQTATLQRTPLALRDRGDGNPYCLSCGVLIESREGPMHHSRFHGYEGYYRINPPVTPERWEVDNVESFRM
jgi:hypothetical protein